MESTVMRSPDYADGGHRWMSQKQSQVAKRDNHRSVPDSCLPIDPREWSRSHVDAWLRSMAARHGCIVDLRPERFLMNGKALCLMTVDMYLDRVPLGGKLLYRDFQIRLARAMYLLQ